MTYESTISQNIIQFREQVKRKNKPHKRQVSHLTSLSCLTFAAHDKNILKIHASSFPVNAASIHYRFTRIK